MGRPWITPRRVAAALLSAMLAAGFSAGCASLDGWQRQAIFQHTSSERWVQFDTPAVAEAFDLPLENGGHVHAWFLPADQRDAPTVLFLHGARRNLNGSAPRIERLREVGFHVLAIDYRGFGKSTSLLPSEQSAIEDTRRAFEELKRREPDASKRFVYGYSLGGALAIELAAREVGLAGVIVESSFTSIADLVRSSRWGWVPGTSWLVTQDFDSLARVAQVDEPLLLLHGMQDGLIPHSMSDRLHAAAVRVPPALKQVVKVEGASHRGVQTVGGRAYDDAVRQFSTRAAQAVRASASLSSASPANTDAAKAAAASTAASTTTAVSATDAGR